MELDALETSWVDCSQVKLDVWLLLLAVEEARSPFDSDSDEPTPADGADERPQDYMGLVLREMDGEGQYRRVGLFSSNPFRGSFWRQVLAPEVPQTRVITIL